MTDPFQIEQRFQEIRLLLNGPASARWRLVALGRFLEAVDLTDPFVASYLLELCGLLPGLVRDLDPTGLDPAACAHLLDGLVRARTLHPELAQDADVTQAIDAIREATALVYAYVGEVEAAYRLVAARPEAPAWLAPLVSAEGMPPKERLEAVARAARQRDDPSAGVLEHLAARWHAAERAATNVVVVPVVEHALLDGGEDLRLGGLRPVTVEVFGAREEGDDVAADVSVFGAEDGGNGMWAVPAAVGRAVLSEEAPSLAERYVAARVRFGAGGALHAGRSADLAVAVLFVTAVQAWAQGQRRYVTAPGMALTGSVDADGQVAPVEAVSLAEKVRAAFCSWVKVLVVPRSQLEEAERLSTALTAVYPHRRLEVVGVGHVREVFFDRRLTVYREDGVVRHAARWAWRRKFSVGGVAVIALLLLLVGRLLYGPLDKNPVSYEVNGETLVIQNTQGQRLHEIELGGRAADYYAKERYLGNALAAFVDVNGDGINEVIWAEWDVTGDRTRALRCLDLVSGDVYWSIPMHFDLESPHHPAIAENSYIVSGLLVGDYDDDGRSDLIASINHRNDFPGLVVTYDARTGQEVSRYLHTGWLESMRVVDLDGDGIPSLLVGGTNNAHEGEPVLAVLDVQDVSGHSPVKDHPKYAMGRNNPTEEGQEQAYLRFPRTGIEKVFTVKPNHRFLNITRVMPPERRFEVRIKSGTLVGHEKRTGILYLISLGFDLEPQNVLPTNRYKGIAQQLYEEGHITHLPDQAYWRAYMANIQYWNGETWQAEPYVDWGVGLE